MVIAECGRWKWGRRVGVRAQRKVGRTVAGAAAGSHLVDRRRLLTPILVGECTRKLARNWRTGSRAVSENEGGGAGKESVGCIRGG